MTFQKAIPYHGHEMTQLLQVPASSVIREQLKQWFCCPALQLNAGGRFSWLGEGTTKLFQNGVSDIVELWHIFFYPFHSIC